MEYLAAVDEPLSTSYFQNIKRYEDTFKTADDYVQEVIEPTLDDDDDNASDNSDDNQSVVDSDDSNDENSSDA